MRSSNAKMLVPVALAAVLFAGCAGDSGESTTSGSSASTDGGTRAETTAPEHDRRPEVVADETQISEPTARTTETGIAGGGSFDQGPLSDDDAARDAHEAGEGRDESATSGREWNGQGHNPDPGYYPEPEIGHDDLPKHRMTLLEDSPGLSISPFEEKQLQKRILRSAWADAPGYEDVDDPERDAASRGRRIVEEHAHELGRSWESLEDLVGDMLAALANGSAAELEGMFVTQEEFDTIAWPEMPQSRPALDIPASEGYFFLSRSATGGVSRALERWGGIRFEAARVVFEEGVSRFANFNIYSGMKIFATPTQGGPITALDFCTAVIERNGRFKVYAYKD